MRLLAIIVLLCVICTINAAVSFSLSSTHPDHPGKCWDEQSKTAFDIGTHRPKEKCIEIDCDSSFTIQKRSCGLILPPPGYRNEIDVTKEYPDCCIHLVKIENNEETEPEPSAI